MHLRAAQRLYDKPNDGTGGTPAPVVEAKVEPVVEAKVEPKVESVVEAKVEPPKKDWRDERIAKLTHDLNEERRQRAAATPPVAPQAPGETDAQFQARVDEAATLKAQQIAFQVDWDRRCNEVADAGKKEFQDFPDRLGKIVSTINGQDQAEVQAYNEVLAAAMETGQAHKVIYALGADPGEFQRLMKLSPVKRAMELGTMAAKLQNDRAPSNLPEPIKPIGSSGEHYEAIRPDDPAKGMKLPKKEWYAQRDKQARERGIQ